MSSFILGLFLWAFIIALPIMGTFHTAGLVMGWWALGTFAGYVYAVTYSIFAVLFTWFYVNFCKGAISSL